MSSASGDANTVIGHVTEAAGPVIVVNQDGEQRILETGDAVYLNEKVITQTGASVSIRLTDNRVVSLSEQSSLVLNDSFRTPPVEDTEDPQVDSQDTPGEQRTIAEIVQGADPVDVSPASLAGENSKGEQSADDGDAISEPVSPGYTITPEMPLIEREENDSRIIEDNDYELADLSMPVSAVQQKSPQATSNYTPIAQSSRMFGSEDGNIPKGQLSVNLLEHTSDVDADDSLFVSRIQLQSGNEAGINLSLSGNELVVNPQAYKYLAEGEQETLVYEYRVADIQGAYVIQTAEIIITGENDLPTITSAVVYQGDQNAGSLSVNLLDGASDIDLSDSLNVVSLQLEAGDPQGISFDAQTNTLEVDSFAYAELAEGETETVEYSYQVDDGHGGQVEQTATLEIEGINDAPTSQDTQASINEDTPYTFMLTDFPYSDIDNNDQLEYIQISTLPTEGLIFLNGQPILAGQDISRADIEHGLLIFTPEDNASGDSYSSFTFRVSDGDLLSAEQIFSIDVVPVADEPELSIEGSKVISELDFESDLGDWAVENSAEIQSNGGSVGNAHSGSKLAELDAGSGGTPDAYYYDVDTSQGHDHELVLWLRERDGSDYTDDVEIVWNGEIIATIDPAITWGEYRIQLPNTGVTSSQVVIRELASQNQGSGPLLDDISVIRLGAEADADHGIDYSISSSEDTPVPLDIEALLADNDSSESLSVTLSGVPAGATITDGSNTLVADGSTIDLTGFQLNTLSLIPVENSNTDFDLTITATSTESANNDQATTSQVLHVDLVAVNDAPESTDSSVTIDEDTPHIFAVTDFSFADIDTGNSLQSIHIVSLPASGSLLFNRAPVTAEQEISRTDLITGRLKFEPAADENGNDYASFQFRVGDGELYSEAHSFNFNVTPINDVPDIDQSITSSVIEDAAMKTVDLLQHASDVDGDALEVSDLILESGNDTGVTVSGNQLIVDPGSYNYLPDNQTETLIYRFNVTDNNGGLTEQTATLTITGTNDGAIISGTDVASVTEDSAPTLEVSGVLNITDADTGEAGFIAETVSGTYGQLTISSAGNWTYQVDNSQSNIQSLGHDDTASESLSIRSIDGTVHNISISLIGINDVAQITGASSAAITEDVAVNAGNQLLASGQLQVTDVDSGEAVFNPGAVTGSYGSLNIDSSGNWVYTADNTQADIQSLGGGEQLVETVTVTTQDGSSQDITVTINGSNDVARISGVNAGNVTEDAAAQLTSSGQLNITDTDAGEDEFTAESQSGVYGDISIDAEGNWIYSADSSQADIQELDNGKTLTDSFTVSAVDGTSETIEITLHGENDAPVVDNAITDQTIAEEQAFNFQVPVETFSDIDGDNLTYSAILSDGSPLPDWLSFDPATRTFSGTPDDPDIGSLDIRVMANDGTTATAAEFSLEVTPVNDPPELQPGSFSIEENSTNGSVLGLVVTNDVDSPFLTYSLTDDANGRFVINSSTGEITVANSSGLNYEQDTEHTITVQVSDGQYSDTQNYTVSVLNKAEAPVISSAVDETGTDDSGVMSIDLLENATAVDSGETLSVNSLSLVEGDDTGVNFNGTTMTVDASQYAYLPDGVSETIQYSYNVVGSAGESSPQTITLTITGNNEAAQIAGVDSATLTEDSANASDELVAAGVLTVSDTDQDEEFFVATDLTGSHGTLSLGEDGNWNYTADNNQAAIQELKAGETLEDGFTITSADGTAHQIVITINGTNDAPLLSTAPADQTTAEEDSFSYQIPANTFTDIEGEALTYSATLQTGDPLPAWLSFDPVTRTFSGTPDDADLGAIDIRVTASDGTDNTVADFSLTVTSVNDTPVVSANISKSTNEDVNLTLTNAQLLENVSDIDGDSLIASNLQVVSGNVSVTDNGDGTWIVSPAENWSGAAQISFDISDGVETVANTLNLNIDAVADLPITIVNDGNNENYFVESPEDTPIPLNISVALHDTDGSETLDVEMGLIPVGGTVSDGVNTVVSDGSNFSINGWDWANMVLTPPPNQEEDFSVYIFPTTTETSNGSTAPFPYHIRIDIQPRNDAAVIAGEDTGTVTEDDFSSYGPLGEQELIADGTLTVSDIDTEAEFVAQTIAGSYGELTINTNGQWEYIADSRSSTIQELGVTESLDDVITVQAADGTTHNITVTIHGANDQGDGAPVYLGTLAEDNSLIINESSILNAVTDIDGDTLTVSAIQLPVGGHTIVNNNDGTWTLTPAENFNGMLEMLYVVSDGIQGYEVNNLVRVNITAVADTAVISGEDSGTVTEDSAATLTSSGVLSVSDPDAGEAGFNAETVAGTYGSLTIDASGNWTYSADDSQSGIQALKDGESLTDTLSVSSIDGTTQNIEITINGTSDVAVIGGTASATVTEDASASLTTSGNLTINDPDAGEAGFVAATITGTYGSLTIDAQGDWTYSADNSQSAVQSLGEGDTLTDSFTVESVDGTSTTITMTLAGTNDAAVIAGVNTASVTENSAETLTATGTLTISDADSGEASFSAQTVSGQYGSLTLGSAGNWSYAADSAQVVIQSLGEGDSLDDVITVSSADGTAHQVTITISGTNDTAVIEGVDTASIDEDSAASLEASGTLTISDVDSDEDSFTAETISGTYGSLTIDADGNWSYSADNSQQAIQSLGDGDSLTDSITVQAADGTTKTITITLTGTNDAAVIGGVVTADLTEDSSATLIANGTLTISDTDTDEALFSSDTVSGNYGTLTIDAAGNWSYSADSSQAVIQALGNGDSISDQITVSSLDGTSHQITININGTNDSAVIGGTDTASLTEDSAATLTASGALTVSDVDTGEASFTATTVSGSYGSLTIDSEGSWNYSADSSQQAIQFLGTGEVISDSITVSAVDGTTHQIVISISGTNDSAVIGGVTSSTLTEDSSATLTATGALTISDVDTDEDSFVAENISGSYGSLTIDTSGNWTYTADNNQSVIQSLGDGDSLSDTVSVTSKDGTAHQITITINGTNDSAIIGGTDTSTLIEDSASTLTASGSLTITDTDSGDSSFIAEALSATYGLLTIDADGNWSYSADNSQQAIQSLGDGDSLTDSITVQAADGTTKTITITLTGTNDAAVIGGVDTADLTEDSSATLIANGTLTISDTDTDEALFSSDTVSGNYGTLTIDAAGNWSYSADSSQAVIQALGNGDSISDQITVSSLDGTSHQITININGTNDSAVIGGTDTASLTEDSAATLTASGALTVSDVDTGEASFTATTVSGSYGSLTIDSEGSWNYSADSSQQAIQFLGTGEVISDSITVSAVDGTTHQIVISISGTNDSAVIGGVTSSTLTEDSSATLTATGTLTISDVDTDEDSFTAETISGTYGSLTIDADGNWSYSADNSQQAIQSLGDGDSLTDSITVQAADGTTKTITITLTGTNDAAVIGGVVTADLTEDSSATLIANGTLTISDTDTDEALFSSETVSGNYGTLTIDAAGNWSYSADSSQAVIQALGNGDSISDQITVFSLDGTSHQITININGTNDSAVIGGTDTASLTEDSAATLTASGALTVSDVDTGEASFTATTVSGSYGSLTIDSEGSWNYSADSSQQAIQFLGTGEVISDSITVSAVDGTTHQIVISISGTNDSAVIGGVTSSTLTEDSSATLTATGALTISDVDTDEDSFTAETISGTYGSLTIDADGNWSYSADNSQQAIQSLGDGDSLTDSITVQAADGTTKTITITLTGTNDAAVIGGVDTADLTEDSSATLIANGTLTISDTDTDEALFSSDTVSGNYGTLTIDAAGNWSYSADSSQAVIQALGNGDSISDQITVSSLDGTSHQITININGTNDSAVIGGTDTASLTEDSAATLTASGALTVSDVDTGEASFTATTVSGSYGSLTIDSEGSWNYSADSSQQAIQFLGTGEVISDSITVSAVDGTTHQIVISISGTNDSAVIGGVTSSTLTEDSSATLTATGALTISDVDTDEDSFVAENISGSYGSLTIDTSGNWTYTADNNQSVIQSLGDGDSLSDTVSVTSKDGTAHQITITINGTNDSAIIGGTDTSTLIEDSASTLTASGSLTITDTDSGDSSFIAEALSATYGLLTIDADGNWSYSADNSQQAIQSLGDGDSLTDSITVQAADGTTKTITITLTGTNDAAVIGGVVTADLTEDSSATLIANGTLTISDTDTDEALFSSDTVSGNYGTLTIDAAGNWSYSADSSQAVIQALGNGDSISDQITVSSLDGTSHQITININGTNDSAVIGGVTSSTLTEDSSATLTATGTLTISDVDTDEDSFTAETISGTYGSLTIDADGNWSYSADNSQQAIQSLGDGDSLTDSITVQAADGTTKTITITLTGTNDAAVIGGVDTADLTEDSSATLIANGTLTISDTDTDEALFSSDTVSGNYGTLTIDAAGNWSYSADSSQAVIQALGNGDSISDQITVFSLDGTSHQITININGTNDSAVIGGVTSSTLTEDSSATLTATGALTISDVDADEDSFAAETISGTYGSLTIDAVGNWTYSADNSQSAIQALGNGDQLTDQITVTAADGTTQNITITLEGTNDQPVLSNAVSDQSVFEDSEFNFTVPANTFSDTEGDSLTYSATLADGNPLPVWLNFDSVTRTFSGTPDNAAVGSLAIKITASDGEANASTDISLTVANVNDSAVITGVDTGSVTEDAAATLAISGKLDISDDDIGESLFTADSFVGDYGSLSIDASGNWSYSADNSQNVIQQLKPSENLTETFTVSAVDGTSHSITLTIDGNDDAPITAAVDLGSTDEDSSIVITEAQLLANASDVDGDTLSVSSLTINNPAHGSVTDNSNGTWTFSPAADLSGNDIAFDFTVSDGSSGDEASGTATIDIAGVVDAPTLASSQESFSDQVFSASKVAGWSTTGTHWSSTSGETMIVGATASRMIDTSGDNVEFSFALTAYGDFRIEWNGQVVGTVSHSGYSFRTTTVTLPDTNLPSTELKIITINRQGSLKNSTLDVDSTGNDATEDTAVALDINAALSDTDGSESLQVELSSVPDGATLSDGVNSVVASGGTVDISGWNFSNITFTPPANESGNYELQVTATSSEGGQQLSESLSIELNVAAVNDTATAISLDSLTVSENSNGAVVGSLATTDADTGDSHSYTVSDSRFEVVNGQLKLKDGISLDHETEPTINLSVTTTDQDSASFTENFSLSVTGVNDAPITSAPVSETTNEDTAITISEAELLANASDVDGDSLSVSNVRVDNGQVSVVDNGDSTWTVTPDNHWSGNGQLLFDISDGTATITSQLDISVTPDADTPQLTIEGSSVITSMNFDNGLEAGWTAENGVETHNSGGPLGSSPTGSNIAELDEGGSGNPDAYYYSVDTSQGHDHEISLWVKERDGYGGTDGIEVVWNGQVLQTIDPGTSWQEVSITLPDTEQGFTQLAVREVAGQNNGVGPLLDSIEITQIGADDSSNPAHDKALSSTEDTRIALDLSASLADSDGSETVTTTLSGIPTGFGLSDGSNSVTTDGSSVDVSGWNLANLTLTPVANHETDFTLTITTTATESVGADSATNSQTIFIDVQPVQDVAIISGDDTGDVTEDAASTLTASGSLSVTDVDVGEDSFTAETITGTYGSLTIDTDGNWSYSADNSQSAIQSLADSETLTDVLTVQSLDGTTNNVTITINGNNDIASSSDQLITLNEDGTYNFSTADFSFSDTDSSDSLQAITITQLPANGELKLNGADVSASDTIAVADIGNLTFSPADNDNGVGYASVQFTVSDGTANSSPQTLTFDVTAINDPPTAPAPEIDQFNFTWGGASMDDKVTDTYTLPSDFSLGDSFWVHKADDAYRKAVEIQISDNDDGTLNFKAIGAAYTTSSNWNSLSAGQQETFFENGNGSSQLVATSDSDSGYGVSDIAIHGGTPVSGFLDSVTGVDIHPFFVTENGLDNAVIGTVSSTDLEGDTLTFSLSNDAGGRFAINSSTGEITVADSSLLDFETAGTHSVTVEVSDGNLTSSRDYSIYIQDTNDAPELLTSLDNQVTAEEAAFSYTLPANAFGDQDNDTITYSATLANDDPLPAWLSFDSITRTFSGTPDDPDIGSMSVKITLSDGSATTDVFWSVEVTAVNDAATFTSVESTSEDFSGLSTGDLNGQDGWVTEKSSSVDMSVADVSHDGTSALRFNQVSDSASASKLNTIPDLTSASLFAFEVDAAKNWLGTQIGIGSDNNDDGKIGKNDNELAIAIRPSDHDDQLQLLLADGSTQTVAFPAVDGNAWLSYRVEVDLEANSGAGAVTVKYKDLSAGDTEWSVLSGLESINAGLNTSASDHTNPDNWNGVYILGDGESVIVDNLLLEAQRDESSFGLTEDSNVDGSNNLVKAGQIIAFDADTGESNFNAEVLTGTYGSLTIDSSGNWTYTADNNQTAIQALDSGEQLTETITVTTFDGTTHNITLTINGANDAPELSSHALYIEENSANSTVVGTASATDVDNETLTYSLSNDAGGRFTIDSATGAISVADSSLLNHETNASHTVSVQVSDGTVNTSRDYTIYVTNIDEAPTASDNTLTTSEDISYTLSLIDLGYSDQEGADLSVIEITALPSSGALNLNGVAVTINQQISKADIDAGNLVFVPTANEAGDDYTSIGFKVSDGNLWSDQSYTLTMDVNAIADQAILGVDAPIATTSQQLFSSEFTGHSMDGWSGTDFQFFSINGSPSHRLDDGQTISRAIDTSNGEDFVLDLRVYDDYATEDSTQLEVVWDGSVIATLNPVETLASGAHNQTVTLPALGTESGILSLRTVNGGSTYLDNIRVYEDLPNLVVDEDTSGSIDLSLAMVDVDSSETLALTLSGLPAGAVITDGSHSVTSTGANIDITGWNTDTLSMTPAVNDHSDFSLVFTASTSETTNSDTATVQKTIAVTVNSVMDAPVSADNALLLRQGDSYSFKESDFSFSDVDSDDTFQSITIAALPASGSLSLNGAAVTATQIISVADIPNLVYTAPATNNDLSSSFTFTVSDGSLSGDPQTFDLNVRGTYSALQGSDNAEIISGSTLADTIEGRGGDDSIIGDNAGAVPVEPDSSFISQAAQITLPAATGLKGEFFDTSTMYGALSEAVNLVTNSTPKATFTASSLNYANTDGTLAGFLGGDASSLSGHGNASDETFALKLTGYIRLSAGTHDFNVTSDDGFSLKINNQTVTEFTAPRGSATSSGDYTAPQDGLYEVELIYWQGSGGADMNITSNSLGALEFYDVLPAGAELVDGQTYYDLPTPDITVDVADGVTLSSGTNNGDGTWTLKETDLSGLTMTSSDKSWDDSLTFTMTKDTRRTISIGDSSFEGVGILGEGGYVHRPGASAWGFSDNDGIHDYDSSAFNDQSADGTGGEETPDGYNAAFINTNGGVISQTLSETFDRSTSYQLQVDIGNRLNSAGMGVYEVRLTAGGVTLVSDGSLTPGEGEFETLTINLDGSTIASDSAAIGQPITIELVKHAGYQVAFDNVRMTATTTEQITQETINTDQSDQIIGGEGNDILTGGHDSDIFIWHAGDGSTETPAEDIITDFHVGQDGDVLDLSDVLMDEENHPLDEYLHFNFDNGDTTVEISAQAGGDVTQKVTLQGVDLSGLGASDSEIINNLLSDGNLQIDS